MSDDHIWWEILAIFILVLANGFFALAEFSVIASRWSKLKKKIAENKMGAVHAEKLRRQPESFLASVQVGITLVGAALGVFSGATVVAKLETWMKGVSISFISDSATTIAMIVVVLGVTILSVVLGELVPKYIALSFPERYARLVAGPITVFIKITFLFSRALSSLANGIVSLFGIKRSVTDELFSEEEIVFMLTEGSRKGVFEKEEQQFIRSVFEFTDSTVRRAMTPRTDVVAVEKSSDISELYEIITRDGYSRYPVYDKTIDKVVGIIYAKDLIIKDTKSDEIKLSDLIREPFFIPDSLPLPRVLKEFQRGKNHLAVVLDEFGGTAGIITLEDVLEELVGEIQDEYDTEVAPLVKHSDNVAYASGDVWPGEVNALLNCQLPEENYDTLAGLIMDTTGNLPQKNEVINIAECRLTVLAIVGNRIIRLRIEKLSDDPGIEE